MKYLLNIVEVERLMKLKGIKSISQLYRESGLKPASFFTNQRKNKNNPVTGLHTVYMISKRLNCHIEEILIVKTD